MAQPHSLRGDANTWPPSSHAPIPLHHQLLNHHAHRLQVQLAQGRGHQEQGRARVTASKHSPLGLPRAASTTHTRVAVPQAASDPTDLFQPGGAGDGGLKAQPRCGALAPARGRAAGRAPAPSPHAWAPLAPPASQIQAGAVGTQNSNSCHPKAPRGRGSCL